MPYVMVLPTKGNQWKTMGGSLGFLNSSCDKTLRTTETKITPKTTVPTWEAVPSWENCWDSGPARS